MDDIEKEKDRRRRCSRRSFVNKKISHIEKDFNNKLEGDDWRRWLDAYSKISRYDLNQYSRRIDFLLRNGELEGLVQFTETLNNKRNPSKFGLLVKPKFSK